MRGEMPAEASDKRAFKGCRKVLWKVDEPQSENRANASELAGNQMQRRASKPPKSPISTAQVPASVSVKPIASARSLSSEDSRLAPVVRVQCGSATCPEGETCCNASCGSCTVPGEACSQLVCGMSTTPVSVSCGSNTCNVGESCCNVSCGICARVGEPCDVTKECENQIQYPFSVSCGMATCNTGLVCCNPSCGICARFGEPCSQTDCD